MRLLASVSPKENGARGAVPWRDMQESCQNPFNPLPFMLDGPI